jgi:hypothetical protein
MAGNRANSQRPPRLKVGQQVIVRMAAEAVRGVITEDRGTIGAGGRRLWRVRLAAPLSAQEPPLELEVPADRLTPAAPLRLTSRPRRASRHTVSSSVR